MLLQLIIFTSVATAATIFPVYKIRRILARIFKLPVIGFMINLGYGLGTGWILLKLFAFQSSLAGLANLLSSIIFTGWIWVESKKLDKQVGK